MDASSYNPTWVQEYFDEEGERELERLTSSPSNEVSLHIHLRMIERFIEDGMRVLEIGAGAGRFTSFLAAAGAVITVVDLSSVQLELNKQRAEMLGIAQSIEAWRQADICRLDEFNAESFDAVVVFGGPFSYVLERRHEALNECLRVLKPGGVLLASVMSLWGTCHRALPGVMQIPDEKNQAILLHGDLTPETVGPDGNYMHLFRAEEYLLWLQQKGFTIEALSASGVLSQVWGEALDDIRADPDRWKALLSMEVEASKDRAALGMGTHLLAAARKPVRQEAASGMKVRFRDHFIQDGVRTTAEEKEVYLPFHRVTARALIMRREDGAALGTQHREGARFALPGGSIEDGEAAHQAVLRELDEENIALCGNDDAWQTRIAVDFFAGYGELSVWYMFLVDEASIGSTYENVHTRWIQPDEDSWHPHLRDRIRTFILRSGPAYLARRWEA